MGIAITSPCVDGTARHDELVLIDAHTALFGLVSADMCPRCRTAWVRDPDATSASRRVGTLIDNGTLALYGSELPPGAELPGPPHIQRRVARELGLDEPTQG